jgi:hypothetical protein
MRAPKINPAPKTAGKTAGRNPGTLPKKVPTKVPQHGVGRLLDGGQFGNQGGGRPPSALRETLRRSFEDRVEILEKIADGKETRTVFVDRGRPVEIGPSHGDRIRALDTMAKYGLGATRELAVEAIRDRLVATVSLIRQMLSVSEADRLLSEMKGIWS